MMEERWKLKLSRVRPPQQQADLWKGFWSERGYVLKGGPDLRAFEAFDAIKGALGNKSAYYFPTVIPKSGVLNRRGGPPNCLDMRGIYFLDQMVGVGRVLNELTCKEDWLLETSEDAYTPFFEAENRQEGDFITFWVQFGTVFPCTGNFHAPLHEHEHDVPIGIIAQAVGSQKDVTIIWPSGLQWWVGSAVTKARTAYGVPCFACLFLWPDEGEDGILSAIPYKEVADVVLHEPPGGRMTAIIPPLL